MKYIPGTARIYFLVIMYLDRSSVFVQLIRRINVFSNTVFTNRLPGSSGNKDNLKVTCTSILKDAVSIIRNYVDVTAQYYCAQGFLTQSNPLNEFKTIKGECYG